MAKSRTWPSREGAHYVMADRQLPTQHLENHIHTHVRILAAHLQLVHDVMVYRQLPIQHQAQILLYLQQPRAQTIQARRERADIRC